MSETIQRAISAERQKIFLVGASGHCKVVIDLVEREGKFDIAFLLDADPHLKGRHFFGYPVIGSEHEVLANKGYCGIRAGIAAIGSNAIRTRVAAWLTERSIRLVSVIHPSAQIGRGSALGEGTVVMAGAVINSDSRIGNNVIINSKASIDHDCMIGDGVHIAPGATICGGVTVGAETFVCAGATVLPNIRIGRNCTIGSGAVVTNDIPDSATVIGVPAKIVGNRNR